MSQNYFQPFTYDIKFFQENNITTKEGKITENAVGLLSSIYYAQELEQIKYGVIDTMGADCVIDNELLNNSYSKLMNNAVLEKDVLMKKYNKKYPMAVDFGKWWKKNNYDVEMKYLCPVYLGE